MPFTWLSTASMPYPQAFNNNSHPPGPPRIHPGFSVVLVMPSSLARTDPLVLARSDPPVQADAHRWGH